MKISIALFASAREVVGSNSVDLNLCEPATVCDLRNALVEGYPELARLMSTSVFSVDHEYANDDLKLRDGVEVALIPPVSGG
jgi:molybdopterin synthase sulfur carrier subunit